MDSDLALRLVYLALILTAASGGLLAAFRRAPGRTTQSFLIWGLIFAGMIGAYGLWPEIRRAAAPARIEETANGIEVGAAADGHFYLEAEVNGATVEFLIDTGASDVVLTAADAERAGIATRDLRYDGVASTANGRVETARVRLETFHLGPWTDHDARASVVGGDLDKSLLGMSYLGRFNIAVAGDRLRLTRQ